MGSHLDGAGIAKLNMLEDALTGVQRLNTIVERMATAVRMQSETGSIRGQIERVTAPLVGLLKPQFGPIADQLSQLILITTRPGGDKAKLRSLRESVAQIRAQLEIAMSKVREQHAVETQTGGPADDTSTP
jgi:Spy/CpxP family protein refolding chaperone